MRREKSKILKSGKSIFDLHSKNLLQEKEYIGLEGKILHYEIT